MAIDRKKALLEGLSGIEHELGSRKGSSVLSELHEHEHHMDGHGSSKSAHLEDGEHETKHDRHVGEPHDGAEPVEGDAVKEVEHHLVSSGQFDCPHCGGKVKVGAKE